MSARSNGCFSTLECSLSHQFARFCSFVPAYYPAYYLSY